MTANFLWSRDGGKHSVGFGGQFPAEYSKACLTVVAVSKFGNSPIVMHELVAVSELSNFVTTKRSTGRTLYSTVAMKPPTPQGDCSAENRQRIPGSYFRA